MAGEALHQASRLFTLLRAREIQRTAERTLDEIATRFPSHLIDDVNARGLPPDPYSRDCRRFGHKSRLLSL